MIPLTSSERATSRGLLDALIRAGLLVGLVLFCYRIFHPFLNLMLWSLILAVILYPLDRWLERRLHGRSGRAATILVVAAFVLLLVPVGLFVVVMADSLAQSMEPLRSGNFHVPPPPASVSGWPVVGERLHATWSQASTDLTGLAQKFAPQLKQFGLAALGKIAGVGLGLLLFLGAMIIAGIIMAFGERGHASAIQICSRLFGPDRGAQVTALCTSTIRAVAMGVIGIAFIQMLLIGIGFAVIGVPGTGILALAVLLFGIVQLPATIITVPVIAYVFATQGANVGTIVFAVYVFVAGLVDNVLKPMLLGRGVEVPMPVVLIGALGGMVTNGILGLFIGPVVLAVGYQLFWQWVEDQVPAQAPSLEPDGGITAATPVA